MYLLRHQLFRKHQFLCLHVFPFYEVFVYGMLDGSDYYNDATYSRTINARKHCLSIFIFPDVRRRRLRLLPRRPRQLLRCPLKSVDLRESYLGWELFWVFVVDTMLLEGGQSLHSIPRRSKRKE